MEGVKHGLLDCTRDLGVMRCAEHGLLVASVVAAGWVVGVPLGVGSLVAGLGRVAVEVGRSHALAAGSLRVHALNRVEDQEGAEVLCLSDKHMRGLMKLTKGKLASDLERSRTSR